MRKKNKTSIIHYVGGRFLSIEEKPLKMPKKNKNRKDFLWGIIIGIIIGIISAILALFLTR
jgi:phosphotransferase system  glucose/maltose/N-acetylglucosamine-specific IIC component